MKPIPLALGNRRRNVAKEPFVALKNRFVEANPVLTADNGPAFIQRPALKFWADTGVVAGTRSVHQQPGTFNDDAFVVQGSELWRLDRTNGANDGNRMIFSGLVGAGVGSAVNFTTTGDIGTIEPRMFFCDGSSLFVYTENGFATGILTASGAISDGDVVEVGGVYYRFSSGSLDSGAPAGTAGNPWRVLSTGSTTQALLRLYNAMNGTGVAGTDYSTALVENPVAVATTSTGSTMRIRAIATGVAGNGITTTETGANLAWGAGSTAGGGTESVTRIPTPEEVGILDVVQLNNFVFCVPAQGEGLNGRFYWLEPGELTIDPLNYATAERSADPINACEVFSDQLWLLGQDTTEVWYMTGDIEAPVRRLQGVVFDRGAHQGTAVQVNTSVVLVERVTGNVFVIKDGIKKISSPDIAEVIRKAIAKQAILLS